MTLPVGYRKVLRLIRQAEKFHRIVVCLLDTIEAPCNKEAEEHGQVWMISKMLEELSVIKTPILAIIVNEGS